MFSVPADCSIATITELKRSTKETLQASRDGPVYVLSDGKPVAAVVSIELVEMINEAIEDRRLGRIAGDRMDAISQNQESLLSEDDFWARVETSRPRRQARGR
ncbi:MAG TPA: type II toxin-antitoxin system prevent-host-death family antitoxin [Gemmatimonadaceae bacterium]|nr:type II toxin-antitoxin system prevent-host-death family antitoxin [Gemmatimonadaceae bacterium]